jgi:hypothetical protein
MRPELAGIATDSWLLVGPNGRWFRTSADRTVDLRARADLRRLLHTLAQHRLSAPGAPLSRDFLFMSTWPDEPLVAELECRRRLANAIAALVRFGVEQIRNTREGDYFLDPELSVSVAVQDARFPARRGTTARPKKSA